MEGNNPFWMAMLNSVLTGLVGLLGVWIGLFGQHFFTRRNRRNAIKYELLGIVTSYYRLVQQELHARNLGNYFSARHESVLNQLNSMPSSEQTERWLSLFRGQTDKYDKLLISSNSELCELESKTASILSEIKDLHKTSAHSATSSLINSKLKALSKVLYTPLYDYRRLDEAAFLQIGARLELEINVKSELIEKECDDLVSELVTILN